MVARGTKSRVVLGPCPGRRRKAADGFLPILPAAVCPHSGAPGLAKTNTNSRPRQTPRSSSPLVHDEMKRLPQKQAPGSVWDAGPGWHGPHPGEQGLRRTEVPAVVTHSLHLPDASRRIQTAAPHPRLWSAITAPPVTRQHPTRSAGSSPQSQPLRKK